MRELERALPLKRRVVALALLGMFRRIDNNIWQNWVNLFRVKHPQTTDPFPPSAIDDLDTLQARAEIIAEATGMSVLAVVQHFYRAKEVLERIWKTYS